MDDEDRSAWTPEQWADATYGFAEGMAYCAYPVDEYEAELKANIARAIREYHKAQVRQMPPPQTGLGISGILTPQEHALETYGRKRDGK